MDFFERLKQILPDATVTDLGRGRYDVLFRHPDHSIRLRQVVRLGPGGIPVLEGGSGAFGSGVLVPNVYDKDKQEFISAFDVLANLFEQALGVADRLGPNAASSYMRRSLKDELAQAGLDSYDAAMYIPANLSQLSAQAQARLGGLHIVRSRSGKGLDPIEMANLRGPRGEQFLNRFSGRTFWPAEIANTLFPVERDASGNVRALWTGSKLEKFSKRVQLSQVEQRATFGGRTTADTFFFLSGSGGILSEGGALTSLPVTRTKTRSFLLPRGITRDDIQLAEVGTTAIRRGRLELGRIGGQPVTYKVGGYDLAELTGIRLDVVQRPSGEKRFAIVADITEHGVGKAQGPAHKAMFSHMGQKTMESLFGQGVEVVLPAPSDTLAFARSVFESVPELGQRYGVRPEDWTNIPTGGRKARAHMRRLERAWERALNEAYATWLHGKTPDGWVSPIEFGFRSFRYVASSDIVAEILQNPQQFRDYIVTPTADGGYWVQTPELPYLRVPTYRHDMRMESSWQHVNIDAYALQYMQRHAPELYERIMERAADMSHIGRTFHVAALNQGIQGPRALAASEVLNLSALTRDQALSLQSLTTIQNEREFLEAFAKADLGGQALGSLALQVQMGKQTRYLPSVRDVLRFSSPDHLGEEKNALVLGTARTIRAAIASALDENEYPLRRAARSALSALQATVESKNVQRSLSLARMERGIGTQLQMDPSIPTGVAVVSNEYLKWMLRGTGTIEEFRQVLATDPNAMLARFTRYPNVDPRQLGHLVRVVDEQTARREFGLRTRVEGIMVSQQALDLHTGDTDADAGELVPLFDWKRDPDPAARQALFERYGYTDQDQSPFTPGQAGQHMSWVESVIGKIPLGARQRDTVRNVVARLTGWNRIPIDTLREQLAIDQAYKGLVGVSTNLVQRTLYNRLVREFGDDIARRFMIVGGSLTQGAVDFEALSAGARKTFEYMTRGNFLSFQDKIRVPRVYDRPVRGAGGFDVGWHDPVDRSYTGLARELLGAFFETSELLPEGVQPGSPDDIRAYLLATRQHDIDEINRRMAAGDIQGTINYLLQKKPEELFQGAWLRTIGGAIFARAADKIDRGEFDSTELAGWARVIGEEYRRDIAYHSVVGRKPVKGLNEFLESIALSHAVLGPHFDKALASMGFDPATFLNTFKPGSRWSTSSDAAKGLFGEMLRPVLGPKALAGMTFGEMDALQMHMLSKGDVDYESTLFDYVFDMLFYRKVSNKFRRPEKLQAALDRGTEMHKVVSRNWAGSELEKRLGTLVASEVSGIYGNINGIPLGGTLDFITQLDPNDPKSLGVWDLKYTRKLRQRGHIQAEGYSRALNWQADRGLKIPKEVADRMRAGARVRRYGDIRIDPDAFPELLKKHNQQFIPALQEALATGKAAIETFDLGPTPSAEISARIGRMAPLLSIFNRVLGKGVETGFGFRIEDVGDTVQAVAAYDAVIKRISDEILNTPNFDYDDWGVNRSIIEQAARLGVDASVGGQPLGQLRFHSDDRGRNPYELFRQRRDSVAAGAPPMPPNANPPLPSDVPPLPGGGGASSGGNRGGGGVTAPPPVPFSGYPQGGWWRYTVDADGNGRMTWGVSSDKLNMEPRVLKELLSTHNEDIRRMANESFMFKGQIKELAERAGYDPRTHQWTAGGIQSAVEEHRGALRALREAREKGLPESKIREYEARLGEANKRLKEFIDNLGPTTEQLKNVSKNLGQTHNVVKDYNQAVETAARTFKESELLARRQELNEKARKAFFRGDMETWREAVAEIEALALVKGDPERLKLGQMVKDFVEDKAAREENRRLIRTAQLEKAGGDLALTPIRQALEAAQKQYREGARELGETQGERLFSRQRQMYTLMTLAYTPWQLQMLRQWEFGGFEAAQAYQEQVLRDVAGAMMIGRPGPVGELIRFHNRAVRAEEALLAYGRGREEMLGRFGSMVSPEMAYRAGQIIPLAGDLFGAWVQAEMFNAMVLHNETPLFKRALRPIKRVLTGAAGGVAAAAGRAYLGLSMPAIGLAAAGLMRATMQSDEQIPWLGIAQAENEADFWRVAFVGAQSPLYQPFVSTAIQGIEGLVGYMQTGKYRLPDTPLNRFLSTITGIEIPSVSGASTPEPEPVYQPSREQTNAYRMLAAATRNPIFSDEETIRAMSLAERLLGMEAGQLGQYGAGLGTEGGTRGAYTPAALASQREFARRVSAITVRGKRISELTESEWESLSEHEQGDLAEQLQALMVEMTDREVLGELRGSITRAGRALMPRSRAQINATMGPLAETYGARGDTEIFDWLLGEQTQALASIDQIATGLPSQYAFMADRMRRRAAAEVGVIPASVLNQQFGYASGFAQQIATAAHSMPAGLRQWYQSQVGGIPIAVAMGQLGPFEAGLQLADANAVTRALDSVYMLNLPLAERERLALRMVPVIQQLDAQRDFYGRERYIQGQTYMYTPAYKQEQAQWAHQQTMFALSWAGYELQGAQMAEQARHQQAMIGTYGGRMEFTPGVGISGVVGLQGAQMQLSYQHALRDMAYSRQMLAVQRQSGLENAAFQIETAEMQLAFWNQERALQAEIRQERVAQQRRNLAYQGLQMQLQHQWFGEDIARQRQISAREFGWQQEDFEEAIRFARGREKRRLMRERERAVVRYGDQQEQINLQEERHNRIYQLEKKRFDENEKSINKIIDLEDKLFQMQTDHHNILAQRQIAHMRDQLQKSDELHQLQLGRLDEQEAQLNESYELQTQIFNENKAHAEELYALQQRAYELDGQRLAEQQRYAEQMHNMTLEALGALNNDYKDLESTMERVEKIAKRVKELLGLVKGIFTGSEPIGGPPEEIENNIPKAAGGRVHAGQTYLVGDRARLVGQSEPEIFVPDTPGRIYTRDDFKPSALDKEVVSLLRAILVALREGKEVVVTLDGERLNRATRRYRAGALEYAMRS